MEDTLLSRIKSEFQLGINGLHGVPHWERVEKIGLYLAKQTKADPEVVRLFAYLHDSRRTDEEADPQHGANAASFVRRLYEGGYLDLTDNQLANLVEACKFHSEGEVKPENATVATCWDADRLDLWRLGITPEPELLSTEAAKSKHSLEYSYSLHK